VTDTDPSKMADGLLQQFCNAGGIRDDLIVANFTCHRTTADNICIGGQPKICPGTYLRSRGRFLKQKSVYKLAQSLA
jgi:hypothetical protein